MNIDTDTIVAFAILSEEHSVFLAELNGTERYRLWKWGEVSHDLDDDDNSVIIYEMEEGNFISWLGELSPAACELFQLWTFVWDEDDDDDNDDDDGQLPELMPIIVDGGGGGWECHKNTPMEKPMADIREIRKEVESMLMAPYMDMPHYTLLSISGEYTEADDCVPDDEDVDDTPF